MSGSRCWKSLQTERENQKIVTERTNRRYKSHFAEMGPTHIGWRPDLMERGRRQTFSLCFHRSIIVYSWNNATVKWVTSVPAECSNVLRIDFSGHECNGLDIELYRTKGCSCLKQRRPNCGDRAPLQHLISSAPFELMSIFFCTWNTFTVLWRMWICTCQNWSYCTKSKSARTTAEKLFNDWEWCVIQ